MMLPKPEKQLYLIAEQVLIGNRTIRDIELQDDDRYKVMALVDRGAESLSERARKYQVAQRQLKGKLARSAPDSGVLMPDSPRVSLIDLSEYLPLEPITMSKVLQGSEHLHRSVTQVVQRVLEPEDFAAWIQQLSDSERDTLKQQLPEAHQKQWDEIALGSTIDNGGRSERKVSVALVMHLNSSSGAGEKLLDYLDEYRTYLHGKVLEYGRLMAKGIGLVDRLSKFDKRQWQVLVGLTPREDLARFSKLLPDDVMDHIRSALPDRHCKELDEEIAVHDRMQRERLDALVDMLESLKGWLGTVVRVDSEN